MISNITKISVFILFFAFAGFKASAMCAQGAGKCDDNIEYDADTGKRINTGESGPAGGEVICSCSAEYGSVPEPKKDGSDHENPEGKCTDLVGPWDEEKAVGPLLDNCQDGKCMCYRTYQVRVPVWERIDVQSGSSESKSLLRKYKRVADDTCKAVSAGDSKRYENERCLYYSGYNDQPGQENVQHDFCVLVKGSGKNRFDQGGDKICFI